VTWPTGKIVFRDRHPVTKPNSAGMITNQSQDNQISDLGVSQDYTGNSYSASVRSVDSGMQSSRDGLHVLKVGPLANCCIFRAVQIHSVLLFNQTDWNVIWGHLETVKFTGAVCTVKICSLRSRISKELPCIDLPVCPEYQKRTEQYRIRSGS
jgi:hypothetical protein